MTFLEVFRKRVPKFFTELVFFDITTKSNFLTCKITPLGNVLLVLVKMTFFEVLTKMNFLVFLSKNGFFKFCPLKYVQNILFFEKLKKHQKWSKLPCPQIFLTKLVFLTKLQKANFYRLKSLHLKQNWWFWLKYRFLTFFEVV